MKFIMVIGFKTDISCSSTMYSRGQTGKVASKYFHLNFMECIFTASGY